MTARLSDYIEAGKALDADEREFAALALQHIDAAEQAEVDSAWDAEVRRRLDELTSGDVEAVRGRETMQMARARSASRQQ